MTVFADYARYYNLLYADKDYAAETAFVLGILNSHGCFPKTLLDLGCGTGRHALEMTRQGVETTGIDMSTTMLAMGQDMLCSSNASDYPVPLPQLYEGNARSTRLGKKFDAVTSLFHVMSYQTTEEAALEVLQTAKAHLAPGGFFLFDFWHGPGVLTDPPAQREKIMQDATTYARRKATPNLRSSDNIVEVYYNVQLHDIVTKTEQTLTETHTMRYWFLPELRYLAKQTGFRVLQEGGWMHPAPPSPRDWNAWMILCQ